MHPRIPIPAARLMRAVLLCLGALLAFGPALAAQAAPQTFLVTKFTDSADGTCSSSDCSLREAIIAANANPGEDTITVPGGSFTLGIAGPGEDMSATGDLDLRESVVFQMAGTATISLLNDWSDRAFHILPNITVTMSKFVIAGGKLPGGSGGALLNQGTLTLSDSTFNNNTAANGGAIANTGTLALSNSTVSNNSASSGNGGGILSSGTLTLNSVTVTSNNAPAGNGGGLAVAGFATLNTSSVKSNGALAGGGIVSSATLELNSSTVSNNTASSGGGGGIFSSGTLTLNKSAVYGNTAAGGARGGGILNNGALAATNTTISGNTASSGGGLANANSAALANATVARNTAGGGSGGGVVNDAGKTATLKNTILAENNGSAAPDCAGSLTSQGYNLVGTVAGACVVNTATGDRPNQDAQLIALKDNGGATFTHGLLPSSAALDAGNPATPGSGGTACATTDQRGIGRPQMGRCDIGAFELVGVSIIDFAFQPANLVVTAGTTVRWKNLGATDHSTISDVSSFDSWSSPVLNPGDTFLHTFNTNGTFQYHCSFHPNTMSGKITVTGTSVDPVPLLTSLSPNTAAAGSPTFSLVLNGQNFDENATVAWGNTTLQITSFSPTQIIATVPAALLTSPGTVNVRVINPQNAGGESNALKFTITSNNAPVLDSLSPASAPVNSPAFTLTLHGSNFAAGATVQWGSTSLAPATLNSTTITVQIPANLLSTAGTVSVSVLNPPADGGASNALTFTISGLGESPVPAIVALLPNVAWVGSGSFVMTITGSGFADLSRVHFGDIELIPSGFSATQLVVTVPAGLLVGVRTFSVTVSNPAPGGGTSNALPFLVLPEPRVYVPLARHG